MKVLSLHHVAICTADFDRALRFYRDILQLSLLREGTSPKGRRIAWFDAGGTRLEILSLKPDRPIEESQFRWSEDRPGPVHIGFSVRGLEGIIERLAARGVKIKRGPYEPVPGERAAFIEGPDGEEIALEEEK